MSHLSTFCEPFIFQAEQKVLSQSSGTVVIQLSSGPLEHKVCAAHLAIFLTATSVFLSLSFPSTWFNLDEYTTVFLCLMSI